METVGFESPRTRRGFLRNVATTAAVGLGFGIVSATQASAASDTSAAFSSCCRQACKTCSTGHAYHCTTNCNATCCICSTSSQNCFSCTCCIC